MRKDEKQKLLDAMEKLDEIVGQLRSQDQSAHFTAAPFVAKLEEVKDEVMEVAGRETYRRKA